MAGETVITVIGNLTDDPELKFTPSGAAVANFTVASTPRTFDRQTNEWKDGDALFIRCAAWRQLAENCAESLQKGQRVIAPERLEGHERRDQRRRDRSLAPLCHGQGHQGQPVRNWRWSTCGRQQPVVDAACTGQRGTRTGWRSVGRQRRHHRRTSLLNTHFN